MADEDICSSDYIHDKIHELFMCVTYQLLKII